MHRKLFLILIAAILLPVIVFAQDGKLRGRVTDGSTGEPLVGANVVLEGTNLGAAADINGDYVILSVRPGVYSMRVSYVGYAETRVSNVRVNAGITTTQDFGLSSTAVQMQVMEITAERPLIQRNTTNTVRITNQEEIENLPVRGVANILALQPGVVRQAGNLYVRGGRAGEVTYYVDGAPTTNPLFNSDNVTVIQEAIEELQLQAGGYTAEYGGANSGIVRTNLRTGGSVYKFSATYETDDFAKSGEEFLGTTSQGLRTIVATASGPIVTDKLRFFALYQNNYARNRQLIWIEPFTFNLVTDDFDQQRGAGKPLPSAISFGKNSLSANWTDRNTFQGTLEYDLKQIKFRFTGSYDAIEQPNGGSWPGALTQIFRQKRFSHTKQVTGMMALRATHVVDPATVYEIGLSYMNRKSWTEDPDFGENWQMYTDSIANAALGYTGFTRRFAGPLAYSVIQGFGIAHENSPNNGYNRNMQSSMGGSFDLTRQMSKNFELKVGGRYDQWLMRSFGVGSVTSWNETRYGQRGNSPATFKDAADYRAQMAKAGVINFYGYNVDGVEVNDGIDAPYEPVLYSGYVQTKFEYRDVVLNLGLRYEHFAPNHKTFADPLNPEAGFDQSLDIIDPNKLVDAPDYNFWLPRISFSFPVTSSTVFYAQYGKYIQMPSLDNIYVGYVTLSRTVSPATRGNAYLTPVGYLTEPEKTTQYEMGIRQMLTDNFALTLTGFYKDTRDQIQQRNITTDQGVALYRGYLNVDFGTVKGLELTLDLRRTNRFAARVNYTLSDAQGTGSSKNAGAGIVEQGIGRQINFIYPLAYNQTHRGSVNLDYRWQVGEGGPILSGLGANLLFTFNSGHPFTKVKEPASLGQASAWNVGVYPQADPRYSYPLESPFSSTTPFTQNIDLSIGKMFEIGPVRMEVYVNVTNLLNEKQVLNVYPSTGSAADDGWLTNTLASQYVTIPNYEAFYRAINLDNRFSWLGLNGDRGQISGLQDIYGIPRQIRFGVRAEI